MATASSISSSSRDNRPGAPAAGTPIRYRRADRGARRWHHADCGGRRRLRQRRPSRSVRPRRPAKPPLSPRRQRHVSGRDASAGLPPATVPGARGRVRRRRSRRRSRSRSSGWPASRVDGRAPAREFPRDFAPAPIQLLRNNGNGTFTDVTADAAPAAPDARHGDRADRLRQPPRHRPARGRPRRRRRRSSATCATARSATSPRDVGLPQASPASIDGGRRRRQQGRLPDFFFGRAARRRVRDERRRGRFVVAAAPARHARRDRGAVRGLRQRRPARSAGHDGRGPAGCARNLGTAGSTSPPRAARRVDRRGRSAGRHGDSPTSTATATPTSSSGSARGRVACWRNDGGSARRVAARPADRARQQPQRLGSKVEMRAGSLQHRTRDLLGDAAPSVLPTSCSASARARAPTSSACCGRRASCRRKPTLPAPAAPSSAAGRVDRRARSQALLVPVSLHVERQAVRVRHRLHGRRRDGLLGGPGAQNMPDSDEYVRIGGDQLQPRDGRSSFASPTSSRRRCSSIASNSSPWRIRADIDVYPERRPAIRRRRRPFALYTVRDARAAAARDRRARPRRARTARARSIGGTPTTFALEPIRGYAAGSTPLTLRVDVTRPSGCSCC